MSEPAEPVTDDGVEAEGRVLRALFSDEGRRDPQRFLRSVSLPGCRYRVAEAMLRDSRLGAPLIPESEHALWQMFARWLISLDGERHVRVRRHFARLFTPRRVDGFRGVVTEKADALVDAVRARGAMDLVGEFARPLPFSVIVEILGVPEARRPWIAERMLTLGEGFARQTEPEFVHRADGAVAEMLDYYAQLLDERASDPKDDLISVLAAELPTDDDVRRDLLANCVFFVEAGHVTTTSLIAGGMLLLLDDSGKLEKVRSDPGLLASAVEEMLRLLTPVTAVVCRAREDVELEGYRFPAGVPRRVVLAAANRDPTVFADPDRFDIERTPNRHLAFSAGSHFCLGAPLARLHGEVAITTLVRSLPNLRLTGDPVWRSSLPLRALEHLPVAWDA